MDTGSRQVPVMRLTLALLLVVLAGAVSQAQQSKPSDAEVAATIRKLPISVSSRFDMPELTAAIPPQGIVEAFATVKVTSVSVVRRGDYNPQMRYWPVEVCVGTTFTSMDIFTDRVSVLPGTPVRMRFGQHQDDFGDWTAQYLTRPGTFTAADIQCGRPQLANAAPASSPATARTPTPPAAPMPSLSAPPKSASDWNRLLAKHAAAVGYRVLHDHASTLLTTLQTWHWCEGALYVYGDHLEFEAVLANDRMPHHFTLRFVDIAETRMNKLGIAERPAFHVRAVGGANLNFVAADGKGPQIVEALHQRGAK